MYLIATHVVYDDKENATHGSAHAVFDFLKKNNKQVILIEHCLYGKYQSQIVKQNDFVKKTGRFYKSNLIFKSFNELFCNIKYFKGTDVFICVDPLNGIAGVIFKLFKHKKVFIYLTPDYTESRFTNKILNIIYQLTDRVCLKFSNEVWSVSTRIQNKRRLQGLADSKNKLLPNSPDFESIKRKAYDGNKNLVIVSHLSKSLNLLPILEAVKLLTKNFTDIKLSIIGSGDEREAFQALTIKMHLEKNVNFLGQKNHEEVMRVLSESFLGFALYTKENSWNFYGDSMKAREYVACGMPVIINDIPSTADDIRKYDAGLVLAEIDTEKIVNFIEKCLIDKKYYLGLRENAIRLGKDFDKNKILKELLG
ncbi:MAG: glycosyltransferase [Candidatus Moraniibacteriota bacterium]